LTFSLASSADSTSQKTHRLYITKFKLVMFTVAMVKGKAFPLQAWSGPEGSKKLRFPDYMTTA
jgi:hypothetical protein